MARINDANLAQDQKGASVQNEQSPNKGALTAMLHSVSVGSARTNGMNLKASPPVNQHPLGLMPSVQRYAVTRGGLSHTNAPNVWLGRNAPYAAQFRASEPLNTRYPRRSGVTDALRAYSEAGMPNRKGDKGSCYV